MWTMRGREIHSPYKYALLGLLSHIKFTSLYWPFMKIWKAPQVHELNEVMNNLVSQFSMENHHFSPFEIMLGNSFPTKSIQKIHFSFQTCSDGTVAV